MGTTGADAPGAMGHGHRPPSGGRRGGEGDRGRFELTVVPSSERYDALDDRWRAQVSGFFVDLAREAGGLERRSTAVEGSKGGIESVILALGSAGVFSSALHFFRAWLDRDKTRTLEISWSDGGQERTVRVRGDAIDETALELVARAAAERIGGEGWVSPATRPS